MNFFKKLPKEKRRQLVLVGLVTALVLGGLGFGLIKIQYDSLSALDRDKAAAQEKLRQTQNTIKNAKLVEAELAEVTKDLSEVEDGMAPEGDIYSWAVNTIRGFKLAYKVDIPQINQPVRGDVTLLPKFPYKQAALSVSGTAYFHDFGKFLVDFENQFPHMRVLNLELAPASSLAPGEQEKLMFKMDIVTLVKPNT
jgi:Tfp pilus assembly protein PilO